MTDVPLPVTSNPSRRGAGTPAYLPGANVRTGVSVGNNSVQASLRNASQNTNNIANMGGNSGGRGGGGGGGSRIDPTSAVLLASLLAANNARAQQPAPAPPPLYGWPNPYAVPPGYVNPYTQTPAPTAAPSMDTDTTVLLQQLQQLAAPPATHPPSGTSWMVWGAVGACSLSAVGCIAWAVMRGKSNK